MKRLFTAIKVIPDKKFIEQLHSLETSLRYERIKWVEDHNIHITLKFFGETDEKKIPGITAVLRNVAGTIKPFPLQLKGLGIFGSSYEPRVVWTGIEPYRELVDLMKQIHAELKTIGFEPDRQNLVPHLTLGRIKGLKDKASFQKTIDTYKTIASVEIPVESMILFESILKKEGPTYVALETFHF
jgi:RNA 2',3'-cyclic 3'-phosphodiesterase